MKTEISLKRILILCSDSMLSNGVEQLLEKEEDLILRRAPSLTSTKLIREVTRFKPDVVIMDQTSPASAISTLISALGDNKEWQIILIDHHENLLHMYTKQDVRIFFKEDLIDKIRQDFSHR